MESQGLFANWILKKLMIMSIGVLNLYVEEVWLCQEVDEMGLVFVFSTVRCLVLVNGSPTGFYDSSRGLRQRGLSLPPPFLFLMETLNRMITKGMEGGRLSGFWLVGVIVTLRRYLIYYLQMTLLFLGVEIKQLQAILLVLLCSEVFSLRVI